VSDHHQPYIAAVQAVFPEATHVRTGLRRARGETTKGIERSHIPTRDRLRSSRGLKTTATGQRFFDGFEALQAHTRGHVPLEALAPGYSPAGATLHERVRAAGTSGPQGRWRDRLRAPAARPPRPGRGDGPGCAARRRSGAR
jgi:hypothetical protein